MKKKGDFTTDMDEFSKAAGDEAREEAVNEAANGAKNEREQGAGQAEAGNQAAEASAGAGASAAGAVPGAGKALTPEETIAELETQLAEAKGDYLRKAADFENYRKRTNQEKALAIDYANQALLLDLITVIDDFERAIKAAESQREAAGSDSGQIAANFNGLYEGISMIEKSLLSQLDNKWGLKRFDSAGEPFDPNKHEAIMMEKSAEQEEPVVAEDFIKGYTLKDRVIRPAKVKVIMPEK